MAQHAQSHKVNRSFFCLVFTSTTNGHSLRHLYYCATCHHHRRYLHPSLLLLLKLLLLRPAVDVTRPHFWKRGLTSSFITYYYYCGRCPVVDICYIAFQISKNNCLVFHWLLYTVNFFHSFFSVFSFVVLNTTLVIYITCTPDFWLLFFTYFIYYIIMYASTQTVVTSCVIHFTPICLIHG